LTSFTHVDLDIDGDIATIRLNRPEKKNALSPEMHRNMHQAIDEIEARKGVKVVVVTGTGDAFCGGMDLELCFLEPFNEPERFDASNQLAVSWSRRLKFISAVTIAKVNGWCFGHGFQLAGMCDIVIAAEEATFGLSEINFGIFPGGGTMWIAAHNMGRKQALYYALTGETFTGKEAVALGMATRAVPRSELDETVDKIAQSLAKKNVHALASTKQVYESAVELDFPKSIDMELAKLYELSYLSENEWIRLGLEQFKRRAYRPGLESYKTDAGKES
jgi:trans-feruloyl-CoA hydratase/vanillin synthase